MTSFVYQLQQLRQYFVLKTKSGTLGRYGVRIEFWPFVLGWGRGRGTALEDLICKRSNALGITQGDVETSTRPVHKKAY